MPRLEPRSEREAALIEQGRREAAADISQRIVRLAGVRSPRRRDDALRKAAQIARNVGGWMEVEIVPQGTLTGGEDTING